MALKSSSRAARASGVNLAAVKELQALQEVQVVVVPVALVTAPLDEVLLVP